MRRYALLLAIAGLALAFECSLAAAQGLSDPTRPPAGMLSDAPDAGAATASVLQSVIITPTGKSAIIGGKMVRLGGLYGDARVVAITDNQVVLRSASGTETLKMYPDVDMKPAAGAAVQRTVRPKHGKGVKTTPRKVQ